jgi:GT2 family glycosyltransferase
MVTYNRLYFTKEAIDSVLTHTQFPHVLTVVDNNSTDGTQEYLKELHDAGKFKNLVLLPENIGVAKASNLAWQLENFKYYMKYDNDISFNSGCWLTPMIEILEKAPDIGIIGYSFEGWNPGICKINDCEVRVREGNIGGACVVIPERTREKIGYWCEDYGLYSEEDYDYCQRVQIIKKRFAYMANLSIGTHMGGGDLENDEAYFHWKYAQRREGLKILGINTKKYRKNPDSLYITPSIDPTDFEEFIYRGE